MLNKITIIIILLSIDHTEKNNRRLGHVELFLIVVIIYINCLKLLKKNFKKWLKHFLTEHLVVIFAPIKQMSSDIFLNLIDL